MSDDTPTTPKRTRKRAAKVAPPDLVGVMAPDLDPATEPDAAADAATAAEAATDAGVGERAGRRRGFGRAPRRVRPG